MSKKVQKSVEREGFEKLKYDVMKWSAFCAPPAVIYIGWFAVFRDIWIALGLTLVCIVSFLIAVAYWYYKKTEESALAKE